MAKTNHSAEPAICMKNTESSIHTYTKQGLHIESQEYASCMLACMLTNSAYTSIHESRGYLPYNLP